MDSDGKGQFRWKYRIRLQWDKEGIEGLLRSEEKHGVECVREDYVLGTSINARITLVASQKTMGICLSISRPSIDGSTESQPSAILISK